MIYVIGIGPGALHQLTFEAEEALSRCEVLIGYKTYMHLIEPLVTSQVVISNGMRGEISRCQEAVRLSREGKCVGVISSGDAGVYGMAGLIYELSDSADEIRVIPGVTASSAGAALLGAPLMHDYCHISLSDLLTPIDVIMKRVESVALADFVICFYNPRSQGRPQHLQSAIETIMKIQGTELMVGLAKDVGRENEQHHIMRIDQLDYELVDMTTLVIVGNRHTYQKGDRLITPRGYAL